MRRVIEKFLAFIRVNPNQDRNDLCGDKILGYTKSGRAVYENYANIKHKKFNSKDHYDALYYHKKILEKLSTENDEHDKIKFHREQAYKHFMSSVR